MRRTKRREDADFTQRFLMSLVVDIQMHVETADRLRIQIEALAKEHGVHVPQED